MTDGIRLVGYSSDSLETERSFVKIPKQFLLKDKSERMAEKRAKIAKESKRLDSDEWYVYLVDGEQWFYKVEQDLSVLQLHHRAEFLGISKSGEIIPNNIRAFVGKNTRHNKAGYCCYCEVALTIKTQPPFIGTDKTRDHVNPRCKGGGITLPCCYDCNQYKADLFLPKYIIYLNIILINQELRSKEYLLTQTRIKNANKILKRFYG